MKSFVRFGSCDNYSPNSSRRRRLDEITLRHNNSAADALIQSACSLVYMFALNQIKSESPINVLINYFCHLGHIYEIS